MSQIAEWLKVRTNVVTWLLIGAIGLILSFGYTVISGWQSSTNSVPTIKRDIERLYNHDTTTAQQVKRLEKLYDMQNQRIMQQDGKILIMDTVNRMQFRMILDELKAIKEKV